MQSWISSANSPETNFPVQNIPYGVFSRNGEDPVCCIAIGDMVLDLAILEAEGVIPQSENGTIFDLPF